MKEIIASVLVTGALFLGVMVLATPIIWYRASVEAEVYNRVTDEHVTTWEAIWTDIRVDCN